MTFIRTVPHLGALPDRLGKLPQLLAFYCDHCNHAETMSLNQRIIQRGFLTDAITDNHWVFRKPDSPALQTRCHLAEVALGNSSRCFVLKSACRAHTRGKARPDLV